MTSSTAKTEILKKQELIDKYYGKEMVRVIRSLLKHKVLDIESLAKKTGYSINTIRRALYTLHKKGIVYYFTKPEEMKAYWVIKEIDYEKILNTLLEDKLPKKKEKVIEGVVFFCPQCKREYSFEEAEEYEFRCPEDGTILIARE